MIKKAIKRLIQPLHDRVAVTRTKPESISKGGIILPETVMEDDQCKGIVVAIGPKVQQVKKDDLVEFGTYAGTEFEHQGKEYLMMRESDIFMIH